MNIRDFDADLEKPQNYVVSTRNGGKKTVEC